MVCFPQGPSGLSGCSQGPPGEVLPPRRAVPALSQSLVQAHPMLPSRACSHRDRVRWEKPVPLPSNLARRWEVQTGRGPPVSPLKSGQAFLSPVLAHRLPSSSFPHINDPWTKINTSPDSSGAAEGVHLQGSAQALTFTSFSH